LPVLDCKNFYQTRLCDRQSPIHEVAYPNWLIHGMGSVSFL
jgi:hypothetical protein